MPPLQTQLTSPPDLASHSAYRGSTPEPHYRVGMEKGAHNQWSICWSEYNPGWLSTDDVSGIDTALPRNR